MMNINATVDDLLHLVGRQQVQIEMLNRELARREKQVEQLGKELSDERKRVEKLTEELGKKGNVVTMAKKETKNQEET